MRIPELSPAKPIASAAPASKPTAKAAHPVAKQAPAKPTSKKVVDESASWLDDELETSQPAFSTPSRSTGNTCPGCGKPLDRKAVLCVSCGYDTRTGEKRETQHVTDLGPAPAKSGKRSKAAAAGSLLRGTVFSFIAALVGAFIWAVIAYFTMYEFSLIAWGLGGLVGFGMALGHDSDDGTIPGIIAAFMSLFGIIAAKVMIIVIFVGAAVGGMMGELNIEPGEGMDPVEVKRDLLAMVVASQSLEKQGVDEDALTDEQWDQAMAAAEAQVAGLDEAAIDKKMEELTKEAEAAELANADAAAGEQPPDGADPAAPQEEAAAMEGVAGGEPAADAEELADVQIEEPNMVKLFFSEMFSPIDGLFVLLAFFTAYKVGSGEMGD
jgi:hypothetical protein